MKTSKQAVSVLLTGSLLAGGAACMMPATSFAGTVEIDATNADMDGITYNGYKIFSAEFNATGGTAKNIKWADDAMKTTVEGVLHSFDSSYAGTTAFDALDYISKNIQATMAPETMPDSSANTDGTTILANDSLGNRLAKAIETATGLAAPVTASPSQAARDVADGYYLFCADQATINKGDAATKGQTATAPAFVAVGNPEVEPVKIVPKTTIPTLVKEVQEDSNDSWGTRADADRHQDVTFRLTGSVPSDIGAYDTYNYLFVDSLPAGMTGAADSFVVKTGEGTDIPSDEYTASIADGTVTVEFVDAKKYAGKNIVVTYTAQLNDDATVGTAVGKANKATAVIKYANNPHIAVTEDNKATALSQSSEQSVEVYTYELDFHKIAEDTGQNLTGVEFTIQDEGGKWITADGAKSDTEVRHTTNDEGKFSITGIDAGNYTVTEVKAPNGYVNFHDTFSVDLDSEIESAGVNGLQANTAAKNSSDTNLVGVDPDNEVSGENGTAGILVKNAPTFLGLPITGAEGVTAIAIASGVLVAGALTIIIRRETKKAKAAKA